MAVTTGSNNLTTYYAKRLIGDSNTTNIAKALLQLGSTTESSWILHSTKRGTTSYYGIKYLYDDQVDQNDNNTGHDKIELYGGYKISSINMPSAWVQLDTGDTHILGRVGIGYDPTVDGNTYKLYVNGSTYIFGPTYLYDQVGIGYDPEDEDNVHKLYVNGTAWLNDHLYLAALKNIYMHYTNTTDDIDADYLILNNPGGGNIALNAASHGLYLGYINTDSIKLYYSTLVDGSTSQTEFFEVKSNGAYALTRFGVNGQSTDYNLYVNGSGYFTNNITFSDASIGIRRVGRSSSWIGGRDGALVRTTSISGYSPMLSMKTNSGTWEIGAYDNASYTDKFIFSYATDTNYSAGSNSTSVYTIDTNGNYSGNAANVTGTVAVDHGGTGKTTARDGLHALTAGLTEGTADCTADTVFMCGNTNGATNDWYYRKCSHIYNYIKSAASGSWGISVTGSSASCTGNALTCSYPYGFASKTDNATWGNTTGTSIVSWNDSTGGSIAFRRDNPSSGKMSIKVDGRFYGNEGNNPAMLMNYTNGYWGMGSADGASNDWIRTTTAGIIPYQSGGSGSGHCGLGTSSWRFSYVYADTFYGSLSGNATSATYLKDRTNSTASYLNYGASGLAGSSISWMCCWNGYEVRAISKAETFNVVRDNGGDSRWAKLTSDNNFVNHGNEANFLSSGYSGELYINYRTTGGTNGKLTWYRFCNGGGGTYAGIRCKELDVSGAITFGGVLTSTGQIEMQTKAGYSLSLQADGNLVWYQGTTARWNAKNPATWNSSSKLLKENIQPLTDLDLTNFKKLNVISYNYKKGMKYVTPGKHFGLLAEEVLPLYPHTVDVPDDYDESKFDISKGICQPILRLDYVEFVPLLIKIVQNQQDKIESLEHRINQLTLKQKS